MRRRMTDQQTGRPIDLSRVVLGHNCGVSLGDGKSAKPRATCTLYTKKRRVYELVMQINEASWRRMRQPTWLLYSSYTIDR